MGTKNNNFEHRGRFQAQGGGLEESESWAQDTPLTVSKALCLLKKLIFKLPTAAYERRKKQFGKAEDFVNEAGDNGGVFARLSKTFKVKKSKDERVDLEVLSGKAFTKDDE